MSTFLFNSIVFGPVMSRRLGISLGINLSSLTGKWCNFDCIYCECGLTLQSFKKGINYPDRTEVFNALKEKLIYLDKNNKHLTTITFAGNGEPTIHPRFPEIIEDTILLRNQYFPEVDIAVLSNSTTLNNKKIFNVLKKIEKPVLKLDSAIEETVERINNPPAGFSVNELIDNLCQFGGKAIIQTLFIKGKIKNTIVDNTTSIEINAWLSAIKRIKPELVMIYTIERETPYEDLEKIPVSTLKVIAQKVEKLGIPAMISG